MFGPRIAAPLGARKKGALKGQARRNAGSSSSAALRESRGHPCSLRLWPADGAVGSGWKPIAKRVYRLYDEENLKVRSMERQKVDRRQRVARAQAPVSEKLPDGRSV